MIYEVMRYCRNFFCKGSAHSGRFKVENGSIHLPFLLEGQYFVIEGSVFNDGVHQYPAYSLIEEEFDGRIVPLAPPRAFLDMVQEIEEWHTKYEAVDSENMAPFQSESFGGYSYSKGSSNSTSNGSSSSSWKAVFNDRLKEWKKI